MRPSRFLPVRLSKANCAEVQELWDMATGVGASRQAGMAEPIPGRQPPLKSYGLDMLYGTSVSPRSLKRKWQTTQQSTRRMRTALRLRMKIFIARKLLAFAQWLTSVALRWIEQS